MRIATLQFSPLLGDVKGNIRRADQVLAKGLEERRDGGEVGGLDLLVLPEMAFSGYNFSSTSTIKPHLEPTAAGRSAEWARSTARRLGCVVCVGYPEIAEPDHSPASPSNDAGVAADVKEENSATAVAVEEVEGKRFNSLLIVDKTGETLLNYQKRFLYYTDERWAEEGRNGEGFFALPAVARERHEGITASSNIVDGKESPFSNTYTSTSTLLPLSQSNHANHTPSSSSETPTTHHIPTSVGICMDINPYKFTAPWTAFEFAHQVQTRRSKLVILSMAWLTLLEREELNGSVLAGRRPDMDTFQYWIQRFWPLVTGGRDRDGDDGGEGEGGVQETILVFANRAGEEEGLEGKDAARYAGTSCVLGIRRPLRKKAVVPKPNEKSQERDNGGEDAGKESSSSDGELEVESSPLGDVEIVVWDMLGRAEEGVCYVDTALEPKSVFKVARPSH
ncbi:hypothetical protein AJ80_08710 [Polytolypa hystricis UAMH7299]|uniref:CN hydrolase domain-containing protein n=1 Tax=Polytolypa hystricis (strain UAMH7299) TaxID=1447883 RepID=A0A2B7X3B8_POLH7|nr:hypothetical protein AJ80_08710 [Polytolypa hystricis UAMH7299]